VNGTVVAFDREVGLGEVLGDDGVRLPFHCIEIADGSRDIAVGALVRFGHRLKLGRVEAAQLTLR
jgi:CspA family cold shock protein